jgi:hypothetical protein
MFRKLTLSFLLIVAVSKFSFATIITFNAGDPIDNYSLGANDTLFIASGTYTGTVSGLNSNNKTIIVANGATFQPALLQPDNGVVCKMLIYGTFTYTLPLTTNTNFKLDNYAGGIVNLGAMNTKGRDQVWTNYTGGIMNFSGNVVLNGGTQEDDNNVFINYETINAYGNFQMNGGSRFINHKDFNVSGNYKANGGILENRGNFVVAGVIDLNSGASSLTNYCRMEASGGILVSNGSFYNYSYLWARNSDINVTSGTIQNILIPGATAPIIHGRNYTHEGGTMSGPARLYFYGTTSISGGTVGVLGATSDTIRINDITRASPSTIFDIQAAGTVRPNVIYDAWGAPDSLRTYLFGCSLEIFLEIPLAINWNSFVVDLLDNVPVLNWSAEFQQGTVFEIQRSYDGRNFSPIESLLYEEGRSGYQYRDRNVNTQSAVAYYRIKAIEISGVEKYTQIRFVKFGHKPGSIYTAPNPFTSNFILNYRAAEKETITIRILNVSGQQILTKNVTVNAGNNPINITEAAHLAKGIYVIQVSNGSNMISSGKILKQ